MEGYIGEVRMFGGNFAPRGWMFCQGQTMAIAQWDAVYALLGTTYGGDGVSTFLLPNMASRVPVHPGTGGGLTNRILGQVGGTETNTITVANIAAHVHSVTGTAAILASGEDGRRLTPVGTYPAVNGDMIYGSTTNTQMAAASLNLQTSLAGNGSTPVENLKPYLAVNFIICVEGIFPSRN